MITEKPQITQMNADKENPSAPICVYLRYLRYLRFERLNRATRRFWKGVRNG